MADRGRRRTPNLSDRSERDRVLAGRVVLFGCTFAFFLHLCGGVRHLVWDTVHGFELRSIYLSGWTVVGASVALAVGAWVASLSTAGWR
jgi:succinate dehydrogenase / fumarate reductase, cytochrome b subunit